MPPFHHSTRPLPRSLINRLAINTKQTYPLGNTLKMASMNFSSGKQFVKPPQRGIFPLDHDAECKPKMKKYLECLKEEKQQHHKCRELSKEYLQCRMDNELMAKENLDEMGYSEETRITEAKEYDKSKEKEGYVAGKHIKGKLTGWLW